jgi:TRAP-type C4-dicarboxylate transport system permease small subunit
MKVEKIIDSGIKIFCGALIIIITFITFMQIVLRNCFNTGVNWSDEVSQFCMMWLALFGSIWLTKNDQHLNTGIKLHETLNKRLIYFLDGVMALIIAGATATVAYQSAIFSFDRMNELSLSLDWLKKGYIYLALPIAMLAMCYFYFKKFIKNILLFFKKN